MIKVIAVGKGEYKVSFKRDASTATGEERSWEDWNPNKRLY
jgi:hypothetical protein